MVLISIIKLLNNSFAGDLNNLYLLKSRSLDLLKVIVISNSVYVIEITSTAFGWDLLLSINKLTLLLRPMLPYISRATTKMFSSVLSTNGTVFHENS